MCVSVYACLSLLCIIVCEQQLRAAAAAHSFFLFSALSLSQHLRFVEFSPLLLPPEQQQQPQPRRIFSLAATVDSSAWCTFFFARPPPCLHIRPLIVKHVFYCLSVCVRACVCLCTIFEHKYKHT